MPSFATYNKLGGCPVAINYNTIMLYMVEEMKALKNRIQFLEAELNIPHPVIPERIKYPVHEDTDTPCVCIPHVRAERIKPPKIYQEIPYIAEPYIAEPFIPYE
jgi:hypothetical protein